ncbi:MAG: hypothetical protein WCD66_08855, partial [Rhodanobacteraceae bacterium]
GPHAARNPDAEAGLPKANIGAADGPEGERQDGVSKSILLSLALGITSQRVRMDPGSRLRRVQDDD